MKKALIVLAIVTTFLLFGTQAMAYDSILFPYYKSGGGDMTFIQILNAAAVGTPVVGTTQGRLNFYYNYNTATELCTHYDDKGKTTKNDIMLFEVTGQVAGQLLPGDTTSSAPKLTVAPAWGYLIVEQNSSDFATGLEGRIQGQAFVVNVNSGTAFGYNAINDPDEVDGTNEFYYNAADEQMLTFLPETLASTVFYLFPVESGVNLTSDVLYSFVEIGNNPFSTDEGVYDNNESLKSGLKLIPVGCYCPGDDPVSNYGTECSDVGPVVSNNFFYTLSQIMSGAQYNAVKGTGGWTGIYWWDYGYSYKIVTSSVLGKPMSGLLYEPQGYSESSYTK